MKKVIFFFLIFLSGSHIYSQFEENRHGCPHQDNATIHQPPPYKPSNTINYNAPPFEDVIKVAIIFVKFKNDTLDRYNDNWRTTNAGPSFGSNLLATQRKGTGQNDWWNFYDPITEPISSWFCEVSKGKMHVIGNVFTVELAHEYSYYVDYDPPIYREKEAVINEEIFEYLDQVVQVDWREYDKWGHDIQSGDFYHSDNGNGTLDMVFRIFRYNYGGIFSYDLSGWAQLGYIGSYGTSEYSLNWGKQVSGRFPDEYNEPYLGSGVTVMGNSTSGILDKNGTVARLTHEVGHWLFGADHSNIGRMGGGGEYFLDPWERIKLNYLTSSDIETLDLNDLYLDVEIEDYSARSTGKSLLKIDLGNDENFLIASRRRVSKWDIASSGDTLLGNPFIQIDPENYGYGKGVYIYHNNKDWNPLSFPNDQIDLECADGLWRWEHGGDWPPDWNHQQNWLPVINRTLPTRYINDDGIGEKVTLTGIVNGKDGISIQAEETGFHCKDVNQNPIRCVVGKYFSVGEPEFAQGEFGTDKIHTNYNSLWTSRELSGDRYDAWQEGEIFSPYSCPSTWGWSSGSTHNVYVWIYDIDEQNNTTRFKIYREGAGQDRDAILQATPPSKPMGIKLIEYYPQGASYCHPELRWSQNIEPDMENPSFSNYKFYEIYRVTAPNMSSIPNLDNAQLIANVSFPPTEDNPNYIDYSIKEDVCNMYEGPPYSNPFPVRYFIKAVDKYGTKSVRSDFVSTIGTDDAGGKESEGGRPGIFADAPDKFSLKQNYPNPFNPTTNIQFDLPKNSFVTLKIFDVSGREIATLVNEYRIAGSYVAGFNASHLSSGVYFYSIKAGSFEETKRMILIK